MRRLMFWSSCCRVRLSVLPHSRPPSHRRSLLFPVTVSSFRIECLVSKDICFYFSVLCDRFLTDSLLEVTVELRGAFRTHKDMCFFILTFILIDAETNGSLTNGKGIMPSSLNVVFVLNVSVHDTTFNHFQSMT